MILSGTTNNFISRTPVFKSHIRYNFSQQNSTIFSNLIDIVGLNSDRRKKPFDIESEPLGFQLLLTHWVLI